MLRFLGSAVALTLTLADSPGSAGLGEAVALSHRTAETDVHEPLSGCGQRSSTRQQHTHVTAQQRADLVEDQPTDTRVSDIRNRQTRWITVCDMKSLWIDKDVLYLSHSGVLYPLEICSIL